MLFDKLFFFHKKNERTKKINKLARCMLGSFLLLDKQKDISKSLCYDQYDGDTLPPPSGYNDFNRLVSYMSSGEDFESKVMIDKVNAIEMYIEKNILINQSSMIKFLERYLEIIKK